MDVFVISKAVTASKAIASYFGLINSVSSDVKKLLHQSFLSGKQNLEYAQTSSGEMQKSYLNTALGDFISSFGVEKDENLISAYIGAAMCQYLLGDIKNAQATLTKISSITLSSPEISKAAALDLAFGKEGVIYDHYPEIPNLFGVVGRGIMRAMGEKGYRESSRLEAFNSYKEKALLYNYKPNF